MFTSVTKRFFWNIAKTGSFVKIRTCGSYGVFFEHCNIGCSISDFISPLYIGQTFVSLPSDTFFNSFNVSFDKHFSLEDAKRIADEIEKFPNATYKITYHTHLIGFPTKGFTIKPRYLVKIERVGSNDIHTLD